MTYNFACERHHISYQYYFTINTNVKDPRLKDKQRGTYLFAHIIERSFRYILSPKLAHDDAKACNCSKRDTSLH
jgi:hypothetical protein